jgi:hypothetical protein
MRRFGRILMNAATLVSAGAERRLRPDAREFPTWRGSLHELAPLPFQNVMTDS